MPIADESNQMRAARSGRSLAEMMLDNGDQLPRVAPPTVEQVVTKAEQAEAAATPSRDPQDALDKLFARGARIVAAARRDGTEVHTVAAPAATPALDGPVRGARPPRGLRFVHAHHLVKVDGQPAAYWPHEVCAVVRVTDIAVHYGPVTPGQRTRGVWFVAPERFGDEVLEVLAPHPRDTEVCTVEDLRDGDVFSADGGQTWHTCATVAFGGVSVYCDSRRDENAPLRRIELERVERVWRGVR